MVIIQERYHFKYLPSLFKSEKSSITEAQKRYKNRSVYFIEGIIFKRVSHKTKRLANYCPNGDRECVTFSYCQTKHLRHGFCWNEARIHTRHPPNCRTCSFTFTPNRNIIIACLTLFQSHTGWLNYFPKWSWVLFTYLNENWFNHQLNKLNACLLFIRFIFLKQVNYCISDQSSIG